MRSRDYIHLISVNVNSNTKCYQTDSMTTTIKCEDRQTDGWMDGRMDGWMDGRMDGRTDGRTDGWMDGWTLQNLCQEFMVPSTLQMKNSL